MPEVTTVTATMMTVTIQGEFRKGTLRFESTDDVSDSPNSSSESSELGTLANSTVFSDCQLNIVSASTSNLLNGERRKLSTLDTLMEVSYGASQQLQ
jgi:hypothetical protein